MPSRILREGILTSERVDQLTPPAEVFYRRLMSVVDDFGRYYAKPELLRAGLFPLKLDTVRNADIASWIGCAREAGLIVVFSVEGKDYLELLDFKQQARAKVSKFPQPPADAYQVQITCVADAEQTPSARVLVSYSNSYSKTDTGTGPKRRKTSSKAELQPLPENWSPTDSTIQRLATEFKFTNGDAERYVTAFRDACAAKGYKYKDFDAAFCNCVRQDWPKFRGGQDVMPAHQQGGKSTPNPWDGSVNG